MKFLIVTFAPTLKSEDKFYSYAPYVYEMNLWSKYITELGIISPIVYTDKLLLSSFDKEPTIFPIQPISFVSIQFFFKSLLKIPKICFQIYKAMQWADHIHLRCPGNVGLLGCFVQILFPKKPKTVKYAGNWNPKSKQPYSYRLQKWILSNTFLTKNATVLVYGEWPNQSKNIVPFFTASYSNNEIVKLDLEAKVYSLRQAQTDKLERHSEQSEAISSTEQIASSQAPRNDDKESHPEPVEGSYLDTLNFIFVGGLTPGKQPLLSVQVVHKLKEKGYKVKLAIYGEGSERSSIEKYLVENKLQNEVTLYGNKPKEVVKRAYQEAHFLLFISKSEGWPKVVAEAMFWGCLPIASAVSCVPFILNDGKRGALVSSNRNEIVERIENYVQNPDVYKKHLNDAVNWSQQYTLEKFETEIRELL